MAVLYVCFFHLVVSMLPHLMARMISFGVEDFAKKFGNLEPSQFVDIISLVGDKSDNIPGYAQLFNTVRICV